MNRFRPKSWNISYRYCRYSGFILSRIPQPAIISTVRCSKQAKAPILYTVCPGIPSARAWLRNRRSHRSRNRRLPLDSPPGRHSLPSRHRPHNPHLLCRQNPSLRPGRPRLRRLRSDRRSRRSLHRSLRRRSRLRKPRRQGMRLQRSRGSRRLTNYISAGMCSDRRVFRRECLSTALVSGRNVFYSFVCLGGEGNPTWLPTLCHSPAGKTSRSRPGK